MESCDDTKRIISYCKEAIKEIQMETPTGPLWERRWTSLMALLRTACEVLKKDAPTFWKTHMKEPNAHVKKPPNDSRADTKNYWNPDIFGKFIWTDANLFLHQGKLTVGQSAAVSIMGVAAQGLAAGEKPKPLPAPSSVPPPQISYHMNTDPYRDRDPREVAQEAISWLEQQVGAAEK